MKKSGNESTDQIEAKFSGKPALVIASVLAISILVIFGLPDTIFLGLVVPGIKWFGRNNTS